MSTKEEIFEYVMDTPGNTNPAVLRSKLNELPEGNSLPDVTDADNGKVLGVVDGEWAKMSGGNNEFIIGISLGDDDSFVVDTPAATIVDAVEAGKKCRIRVELFSEFVLDVVIITFYSNTQIWLDSPIFYLNKSLSFIHIELTKSDTIWSANAFRESVN